MPVTVASSALVGGTSTGQITLGNATLASGVTLTVGAGAATPVTLASVTGPGSGTGNLTINVASNAADPAVSVGVVGTHIGAVTVTESSGVTFTSGVSAANVALTDTRAGQTVAFQGNLTVSTGMTVATGSGAYNVSLTGANNSIAGATTIANTGTLMLGQSGGTTAFTGGVTATAPSGITISGTVSTSGAAMNFGA